MLAIASGNPGPGKRLPSTRALAKRFRLNVNTVSAAYQQLEKLGWVQSVHGSGVYVGTKRPEPGPTGDALDQLVLPLLRQARLAGFSASAIRNRVECWLAKEPRQFVFVHPERELRAIVTQELRRVLQWPVEACDPEPDSVAPYIGHAIFVTVPSKQETVRRLLPAESELVSLQMHSVDEVLSHHLPIRPEVLLVVASAWPDFLEIARTVLMAAGCEPDALVFCDTRVKGWKRSLGPAGVVICDVATAEAIPGKIRRIVFDLVAAAGVTRLQSLERWLSE